MFAGGKRLWRRLTGQERLSPPQTEPPAPERPPMTELESANVIVRQIDRWLSAMERLRLADYVRYVDDRKRLFWTSFWAGVARGVGMAVGFSILGALLEKMPVVSVDKMTEAIRIELGERKLRFLEGNKKALIAGMEAAK